MKGNPFFDRTGISSWNKGLKMPQISGENHPRYVARVKRVCVMCGEEFEIEKWRLKEKTRGKYCSVECFAIYMMYHLIFF